MEKTRKLRISLAILANLFFFSLLAFPADLLAVDPPVIVGKQQMLGGQQQTLSILNYQTGNTYTWSIIGGGGQLSGTTGEKITLTAPTTNPNCHNPSLC